MPMVAVSLLVLAVVSAMAADDMIGLVIGGFGGRWVVTKHDIQT